MKATSVKVLLAVVSVKAVGGSGTVRGRVLIANTEVAELVPILLMAATVKLYVVPAVNPVEVKEVAI